jgi:hypothetical protein
MSLPNVVEAAAPGVMLYFAHYRQVMSTLLARDISRQGPVFVVPSADSSLGASSLRVRTTRLVCRRHATPHRRNVQDEVGVAVGFMCTC